MSMEVFLLVHPLTYIRNQFVILCSHFYFSQTELKHFVSNMWENQLLTNVTDGLDYLDAIDDGDGAFNFSQLEHMQERYPIVLYPLYRLQVNVVHVVLFCIRHLITYSK